MVQLDHKVRKMRHQIQEQQDKDEQAKGQSANAEFIQSKLRQQQADKEDPRKNQQALERLRQEIEETKQHRAQDERGLKHRMGE